MTMTVEERRSLDERVLQMFALVAEGIRAATDAFLAGDVELARSLVLRDTVLDDLQASIETEVEEQLVRATERTASDVRGLITILRVVPEIERAGDLVEHIALRTPQRLARDIPARCRPIIADMGDIAAEMWRLAADAYAERDPSAAARLRVRDDALDDLHVSLTTQLAGGDLPVPVAIEMGLVARFYERLGDHAVNVARRVRAVEPLPGVHA